MDIRTEAGTLYTDSLPVQYDPCFCVKCGERRGWYDTGLGNEPAILCDECAAGISQDRRINPELEG